MSMSPSQDDSDTEDRERPEKYAEEDEEEAEGDHLAPARWWLVSTLLPLIVGTFGPMASAFNICAVVAPWIVVVDSSSTEAEGQSTSDPRWLYSVNAVSLAIAVVANIVLLAHMMERIPFAVAQPVTIVGWYIASFLLVGIVAAVPVNLQVPGQTLSQGFYYACIAAGLYFVLATMLCVTAIGVYIGRFSRDFKLTMAQRTLMVQTMLFLGYILAAGAVYSRIEGWEYLDAVYWVDVTILTIGYGEFTPKTHLGRSLFFPMAVGGILFVGLIVASVSTMALEAGSKKVTIRMVEKARIRAIKTADTKKGTIRFRIGQPKQLGHERMPELERREQEFDLMRQVQKKASQDNKMIALGISIGFTCFLWFVGAVIFWQAEMGAGGGQWTYFEALYFTYVSFLTIGYGDFFPQDNSAKPAFVFWSLIALPTLTVLIGAVGSQISEMAGEVTLWISAHAPETGPLSQLKASAAKKEKGKDGAYKSAKPPGFMEDCNAEAGDGDFDNKATADAVKGMTDSVEGDAAGNGAVRNSTDPEEAKKAAKRYRPYLLMKEMKNVVNHMNANPPRQYTYAEWTWFLKLLGQDESNPAQHRSLEHVKREQAAGDDQGGEPALTRGKDGRVQPWSWLGHMSPLMSIEEEPKWVLMRLMETLERELKEAADEKYGGNDVNGENPIH